MSKSDKGLYQTRSFAFNSLTDGASGSKPHALLAISTPFQRHDHLGRILALITFSVAIFLPIMGHGFIHDDFVHLCSVAYQPLRYGLTHACGGPFYTPVAWLTYKIDWLLWGKNPFLFAAGNLAMHITNTLLLYWLAERLWHSRVAAWWTAFGFALLFPANSWAVMWISTRAHLLATLFYLLAIHATLRFISAQQKRLWPALLVVASAALSMFSKESGVSVLAAIAIVMFYHRGVLPDRRVISTATIRLFIALLAVVTVYAWLRTHSGAVAITAAGGLGYSYTLSPAVLGENLLRYGWRTYGLLTLLAGAITLSRRLSGQRPRLHWLTGNDLLFSVMLSLTALAPFAFLQTRSGIYSYLPGVGAALWLGMVARSICQTPSRTAGPAWLAQAPMILLVIVYAAFTVGHSLKWKQQAEINTAVLEQMVAQQPEVKPHTFFVLTYSEIDRERRFPEGFAWAFPEAMQILYGDPTLHGTIVEPGTSYSICHKSSEIHFAYLVNWSAPQVVKIAETSLPARPRCIDKLTLQSKDVSQSERMLTSHRKLT